MVDGLRMAPVTRREGKEGREKKGSGGGGETSFPAADVHSPELMFLNTESGGLGRSQRTRLGLVTECWSSFVGSIVHVVPKETTVADRRPTFSDKESE